MDRLEAALPAILDGYCSKSDKPREIAEEEAKEFIQILIDSASYQFGKNHSTGYSIIGYYCAYMRHYYPLEFVTALLINNETIQDLNDAEQLAKLKGIKIGLPKWGKSRGDYFCDKETNTIYKGIGSIKGVGSQVGDDLYSLSQRVNSNDFIDVIIECIEQQVVGIANIRILVKIGYFEVFGDENQLLATLDLIEKRYKRTHKDKTKEQRLIEIKDTVVSYKKCTIQERIKWQVEYFGCTDYIVEDAHEAIYVVLDISKQWANRDVKIYQIKTGKISTIKITYRTLKECEIEIGSTVALEGFYEEPKLMPNRTNPEDKQWIEMGYWEDEFGNKRTKLTVEKQKSGRYKKVGVFNTKVKKVTKL